MALVLPILVLLVFGIIEFGRVLYTYMIVTDLSREGARKGAVGGRDSEIVTTVEDNAGAAGLDITDPNFTVDVTPASAGTRARGTSVTVTVSYPVDIIAPVIGGIIGDPYIVTARTTMRVEG